MIVHQTTSYRTGTYKGRTYYEVCHPDTKVLWVSWSYLGLARIINSIHRG